MQTKLVHLLQNALLPLLALGEFVALQHRDREACLPIRIKNIVRIRTVVAKAVGAEVRDMADFLRFPGCPERA